MGLVKVSGPQALAFIQKVATNDASKLAVNASQYSILCNENGGAVDDILVYRLPGFYLIVVNASNTDKDLNWFKQNLMSDANVIHFDQHCMLSIQGPEAVNLVGKVLAIDFSTLKHNGIMEWNNGYVSRTGYTGEDGVELIVPKREVAAIWQKLIAAGIPPCGLGARDTLRLEAGLPLYGHEYDDHTSPIEAGYSWAVKFDKGEFVGRKALEKQKAQGTGRRLVGLEPEGRQIPRQGCEVFDAQKNKIGIVTSGTFSPTFKKPIALAYLNPGSVAAGQNVMLSIRDNLVPSKIVAKSFYKR
jgi:aminomethyltransferase